MSDPNSRKSSDSYSYRDSGVDIDAGEALVERIKPAAKSTRRAGADASLGGFGGFFDLKAAGFKDPLLVGATDGVGTKLKVAIDAGLHGTVGIDLVAMCVNDLVVQGAEPLFFLDYFGTGKLDVDHAASVVDGIAEGCRQAGCALIGGETAELPGLYAAGDYDLAGFAVGAVEREKVLTGQDIAEGDVVLGLASAGVHSNGYSLVRKIVGDFGFAYDSPAPFDRSQALGAALLTPTRIYVKSCLAALATGHVKGLAHITGGGLLDNIPRVLPEGLGVALDSTAWQMPPVFHWLAETGKIPSGEMHRTFNCGIGMVVIVAAQNAASVATAFEKAGETVFAIGTVMASADEPRVVIS